MDLETLRQQPHWSYSSLNQLLFICSLQWAFRHVYNEEPEFTPVSLAFGKTFHRACAQMAVRRMHGETVQESEVVDFFAETWRRECRDAAPAICFGEGKDADTLLGLGQRMLSACIANQNPKDRLIAVNQAFSVPLIDAAGNELPKPLIGEYDCVLDVEGLPVIVDWKTSASRWPESKAHKDMQATAYLYAHHHDNPGPVPAAFRYDVVTKAKAPTCQKCWTTREPEDFVRLVELARIAEGIAQHELFVPNEGSFYCGGCPYHGACKAWHRGRTLTISVAA